eukprot:SAG31_NODE_34961_length_327_cov_1.131579_1_plen_42_part_10
MLELEHVGNSESVAQARADSQRSDPVEVVVQNLVTKVSAMED